jgi:hypothetical protein
MKRSWILPASALGILALAGLGLWSQFELVKVQVPAAPRPEAAHDPFFAVRELYSRLGVATRRQVLHQELPATDQVLWFLADRNALRSWDREPLAQWVERGGHLVVSPDPLEDLWDSDDDNVNEDENETVDSAEDDGSLDSDAAQEWLEALYASTPLEELALAVDTSRCPSLDDGETVGMEMAGGVTTVRVFSCPLLDLSGDASLATGLLAGGPAASLLRFRRGQGWITILSDPYPLENDLIGELDHARFAWELVRPAGVTPAGVVFVAAGYVHTPPLVALIARHGWPLLVSAALALAILLWSRGARFGPLRESRSVERRSLLEHIEATGAFFWDQRLAEVLLNSTRAALDRHALRVIAGYSTLDPPARLQSLAERTGLAPERLAAALERRSHEDPAEITRVIRTLEAARRSL